MTLPSKHRKHIEVAGVAYHYHFSPFRRHDNGYVAVQLASGSGSKLLIQWVGLIVPRHVRAAIEYGAARGWRHDAGEDFEFGCDSFADPVEFHAKPTNAGRQWFFDQWFADHPDRIFNSPMPGPPPTSRETDANR